MALTAYLTRTYQILHDPTAIYYAQSDVVSYINTARSQVAAESMAIRVLPPSGLGQNQTVAAQEVYNFSAVNPLIQAQFPGVKSILAVGTIAVSQGALKPVLDTLAWSDFQAALRSWNAGFTGWPTICAQYGQGDLGSMYMFPVPTDAYPMDWDCSCLPVDLVDDTTPEVIPYPWTDAVPFFAAYLAYFNAQRPADADKMKGEYTWFMTRATANSNPLRVPSYYGNQG